MFSDEKQLETAERQLHDEDKPLARRESVPIIFDHSYTERQSILDRETKWLGDKARELHRKLAVLKRYQEDIEERTRILREKNLELMERNQQIALGNRKLHDFIIVANSVRRSRERELRMALEGRDEFSWKDSLESRRRGGPTDRHGNEP